MARALDEHQVRHVAHLARLKLTDEEVARFSTQLSAILEYIDQLNELDTASVSPTTHALPICNVFRDDEIRPSLDVGVALKNAPQAEHGFFKVPKVLDQGDE